MRIILTLSLLITISSCANNGIRFVRTVTSQTDEVHKETQIKKKPIENNLLHSTQDEFIVPEAQNATNNVSNAPKIITEQHLSHSKLESPSPIEIDDEPELSQEALDEAFLNERKAKHARNSFIFSLITLTIPVLGLLVSLIFFTIGWIFLRRAARGRYITNRGEKIESTARVLWIIYMAIIAAIAILIASVFFLF